MILSQFFRLNSRISFSAFSHTQQNSARLVTSRASRRVLPYWLGTLGLAVAMSGKASAEVQHPESPYNKACYEEQWFQIDGASSECLYGNKGLNYNSERCVANFAEVPSSAPASGTVVNTVEFADNAYSWETDTWCLIKDSDGLYWAFQEHDGDGVDAQIQACYPTSTFDVNTGCTPHFSISDDSDPVSASISLFDADNAQPFAVEIELEGKGE